MTRVERSALLAFTPAQLLRLVQDVPSYPGFLPSCVAASVEQQHDSRTLASLSFRLMGITESFATENITIPLDDGSVRLDMRLLRGPFKSLSGSWVFQPLGDAACKVSLSVDLEWGSLSPARLLTAQLDRAISAVMQAFKSRAAVLYGAAPA